MFGVSNNLFTEIFYTPPAHVCTGKFSRLVKLSNFLNSTVITFTRYPQCSNLRLSAINICSDSSSVHRKRKKTKQQSKYGNT